MRAYAVNRGWLAICYYHSNQVEQAEALWTEVLHDTANGAFPRGGVSSQVGLARIALDRGDSAAAMPSLMQHRRQRRDRATVGWLVRFMCFWHAITSYAEIWLLRERC